LSSYLTVKIITTGVQTITMQFMVSRQQLCQVVGDSSVK